MEKRRAAVAALAALLGAAALFIGGGAAHAGYPCNDNPAPSDINVNVNNQTFVGVDSPSTAPGDPRLVFVCVAPTGGEASQKWVLVAASDPASPAPGYTVQAGGCTGVVPGDPFWAGCTYLLKQTGAEVDVSSVVTPDPPGGGNGTGGIVEAPGICAYADGATNCVPRDDLVEVSVGEGDLPSVHTTPGCVNVNGTCMAPTVDGARVTVFGDTSNYTLYVDAGVAGYSDEHAPTCVGVDDPCP